MAKPTKIAEKFGVSVTLLNEIDPVFLDEMETLLRDHLKNNGTALPKNAKIYVTQLGIRTQHRHFKVEGIDKRLSYLQVDATLTKEAIASGLAIYDLEVQSVESIPVRRKKNGLAYRLPGSFIAENSHYTDYLAVTVQPNGSEKHRLNVRIAAQATPDFASRLRNIPSGRVISTLNFQLAQELQLTLGF